MGYKKGDWEMCLSTSKILNDLDELTRGKGILELNCDHWMVSDDTVEHLATAEGLVRAVASKSKSAPMSLDAIMRSIARETKKAADDFSGRAPGKTEQRGIKLIDADGVNWQAKPFDSNALGCGAAMRTGCIGLLFRNAADLPALVAVAIETSRLTKTHPLGYLPGVCVAAFVAFALQDVPVLTWGWLLLDEVLPAAAAYVLQPEQRHLRENRAALLEAAFEAKWRWYLAERGLTDGGREPTFPTVYGPAERDKFYADCARMPVVNPSGKNPGSKGYDAVLIAYDALLWVETQLGSQPRPDERWAELCLRSVLHRGDNDSTGSISSIWYGALHGFEGVPAKHHRSIEYRGRCDTVGQALDRIHQQTGGDGGGLQVSGLRQVNRLSHGPTAMPAAAKKP
eukprot:gnl/TRDRNA2_/TRDRNA2_158512_c6_seq1.p1 gnl/TRDRNA2_/TRDRNA2_158512_c6~~gnl/TRDRNA2_/TRDRNA2_158512_c6_seq1.p1  ORF type:complete len:445 (-),score=69.45 gnl/TRDRNA2_/TRDRNA2_158512_c6_seq1:286-1479(-)